tara:strand:- start:17 stop:391 length:375 start_codon:yes stop_codon:yes gene_type:complete
MTWFNIVKGKGMSKWAEELIDYVMSDEKERTITELIRDMKVKGQENAHFSQNFRSRFIPTTQEVIAYLSRSSNRDYYESRIVDSRTGKEVKKKQRPYHVRKYRAIDDKQLVEAFEWYDNRRESE